VLVADTLRADHVSVYGYQRPTTPRLDRLAAEGRLFLNAYSSSSWTLPAHASLLTGRRLSEHRAGIQGRPFLDGQFPTLAEVLAKAGYATGGFVANTFWCGRQTGLSRGFIRYEDFYGNLGDALARTVLGRMLAYEILPHFGFTDIPGRLRASDINENLLRWIDGLGDRPFFALANYLDVHGPYIPPPSHDGRFAGQRLERRSGRIAVGDLEDSTQLPDAAVVKGWIDRYDESLAYLDEQVGQLLDELARRKLLDRTIVVFASDHGENWGEHDLIYHGHSLYLEQVKIPMMIRFPSQVTPGERDVRPIDLTHIPRLVTDLAGLRDVPFPSRPLVAPAVSDLGEVAVSEVGQRRGVPATWPTASGNLRSLQTARWQLIEQTEAPDQLYDLQADPRESTNLAQDSRFAGMLSALQKRLAEEVTPALTGP
jgi:arylsulfatase A-like enzyme